MPTDTSSPATAPRRRTYGSTSSTVTCPGTRFDFIYRPEVPQGPLSRQHYSHLARLMRYIEPQQGEGHAFVIGNLSRDDTQHEPGHGGLALILGLRVDGACDPTGRPDPAFSHAIAAVDRALDADALYAAATSFHRSVLDDDASAAWYRAYVRTAAREPPASLSLILAGYVASFGDLPQPAPSAVRPAWTAAGAAPLGRLVFVHPDDAPFSVVARAATRLAAVLYRSDLRWTAISTGREADLPDGLSVRFVAESAVGPGEQAVTLRPLSAIPEDEEAIARELLGAWATQGGRPLVVGWRGSLSGVEGVEAPPVASPPAARPASIPPPAARPASVPPPAARPASVPPMASAPHGAPPPMVPIAVPLPLVSPPPPQEVAAPPRAPRRSRVGIAAACIALALAGGICFLLAESSHPAVTEPKPPTVPTAAPTPIAAPPEATPRAESPSAAEAPEQTPEPPPEPASPPPPTPEEAPVARAHAPPPPSHPAFRRNTGRCGVLDGKPCF